MFYSLFIVVICNSLPCLTDVYIEYIWKRIKYISNVFFSVVDVAA